MLILAVIAAVIIGTVVRDDRQFEAEHPGLVDSWDQAAVQLGLSWVVPVDQVRADLRPPALRGRVDGRSFYLALHDDPLDGNVLPRWMIDAHVTLRAEPPAGAARKTVLEDLERGRPASATVQDKELRVQRAGRGEESDVLIAYAREVLAGAAELERLAEAP